MKKLFRITLSILIAMFGCVLSYSNAASTGMRINLRPGWNVVSTPALLSNISFSNGGKGISLSKMEGGQWVSIVASTGNIKPLDGFLAKNSTNEDVVMELTYKDNISPTDAIFQKNLDLGWNFLGITTTQNPFSNVAGNINMTIDFTYGINGNSQSNLLNKVNSNYIGNQNSNSIEAPQYGEAYGVFVTSNNSIYGGYNNKNLSNGYISNFPDYEPIIKVTPGSYNIPLLKGIITTDRTISFKDSGFSIKISGANPFEEIWGYEAGGIIYEMVLKVDSCISRVSYDIYDSQGLDIGVTNESGDRKLLIYFEGCNTLSAGTHEISILLGVNTEYYQNFKTGMTITTDQINANSFANSNIEGVILPSVVEISHDNLPHLTISPSSHYVDEVYIDTGVSEFPLRAGNFYTDETGVIASILLNTLNKTDNNVVANNMYVDTYVNGEFVDTQLYKYMAIKHEISIERDTNTVVEFRGRMINNMVGAFMPKVTINKIIKNNINYVTHRCDYYAGWCTEFGLGNYIFTGKLSYVNRGLASGHISNEGNYESIINVTPGSYNIPLLEGRVYVDGDTYLNKDGFIVDINGANPYEDIGGYDAGGIIYDMSISIGDCTATVPKSLYSNVQTNNSGYGRFYVQIPEECKSISAGASKISVSMGINKEYYQNFKPGMTISIDMLSTNGKGLYGSDFNSSNIWGKILPATIQVGHYNLPQLIVSNYTNPTDVFYINSGAYDFPLRSGEFYTEETGIIANVLFKKVESTGFKMYVSTYVNGELLDEQLYENKFIKHEIPIERNVNTVVEFRGRLASNATGYMRPSVIVNRILKNNISYTTHNCDYYEGWCTDFGSGNYIFYGGGIGVGVGSNNYTRELVQAYDYAYNRGLTTIDNIDDAGMYDNITRIEYLQIISDYATNVLGLTPDEYRSCNFLDVTQALGDQYGIVKKACKLGLIGIDEGNGTGASNLNPDMTLTRDYFGTLLSRALNANNTSTLSELNDSNPYYQKHLAFLKSGGILNSSNPNEIEIRGYIFLMLMRADASYVSSEGCTADEILQCLMADDYDACIASCTCTASSSVRNTSSSWSNALALANVSCMWDGTKATIMWAPIDNIGNVKISLYNEIINNFDIKGTVNMHCQRRFTFNVNQSTAPIVRFDDTEGLSAYKTYTCHRVDTLPTEPSVSNNIVDENYINNIYYAPAPFGYDNTHKISVKNITNTSIIIESPILIDDLSEVITQYVFLYGEHSIDELVADTSLLNGFTEILFTVDDSISTGFFMVLNTENHPNLDTDKVYHLIAIPRDNWNVLGVASNEICFKLGDNSFGEGNECSNL